MKIFLGARQPCQSHAGRTLGDVLAYAPVQCRCAPYHAQNRRLLLRLETIGALAMDDLLGGLIGAAVSGELGATPIGVPTEISAILASPEEIADAAAALFLRLRYVVNTENTAPPEVGTSASAVGALKPI